MLRYMLDTNVCIRVLRDRPQHVRARFNAQADGLCVSTVVLMELLHGAAKSARPDDNRREVERFAARLEVLPFDADAAATPPTFALRLKNADRQSAPTTRRSQATRAAAGSSASRPTSASSRASKVCAAKTGLQRKSCVV